MGMLILLNLANGLMIGAFFALMALGLSLILNLTHVINFAHGGFLALGGYIAYLLIPTLGFIGALVAAPLLTAGIGLLVERVLIRSCYSREPIISLLLTFGLAYVIEDGLRIVFGPQGVPIALPDMLQQTLSETLFFITGYRALVLVVAVVAVGVLFWILHHTVAGMRLRAGVDDLETVSALGVNVAFLRTINFGLGIYFAGLAGVLAAGLLGLNPTLGDELIMPSFVAIIVGGLGSLVGTLAGGILIGIATGLATTIYPAASEAVIYVVMALVLIIRPRGLFGEEEVFL